MNKLIDAIKKRKDLTAEMVSLRKLLKAEGMENYLKICSGRIADQIEMNGKNIEIDLLDFPNLLLSSAGIEDCKEILQSYISDGAIEEAYKLIRDAEMQTQNINIAAEVFRKAKYKYLYQLYRLSFKADDSAESQGLIRKWIRAEILHRSFIMAIVRKISGLVKRLYYRVRLHGVYSAIKELTREVA